MCADNISTFPLCVSLSLLILNADLLSLLVRFYSLTKRCLLLLPMLTEGKEPMQLWRWKCGKGEGEASTCSFVVVMDRRSIIGRFKNSQGRRKISRCWAADKSWRKPPE